MATWDELARAKPEMAALGLAMLRQYELAYLATTRRDGSPRVNPVSPLIAGGRLFITTEATSPKRLDLVRDGRYMLHMLPGKDNDAEFSIRGRARRISDAETRAIVVAAAARTVMPGGSMLQIRPEEWLFEYDIEEAASAVWENVGTPQIRAIRRLWRAG